MKFWLFLPVVILALSWGIAHAQSTNIMVDIVPPNPNPSENTDISLSSYLDNLDIVQISWSVDGKNVSSGIGKKDISVNAPAAGKETIVVAKIYLPSGTVETKINLRSSMTVLLWQASDSYVPPFYRGKALPSSGSSIKVVAMPEIRTRNGTVKPENMTYDWKIDYNNTPEASGYGKTFLTFINDYLENSNNVSVTATTTDGRYSTEATVNIAASEPKILFYKNDTDTGTLWNRALSDHNLEGKEVLQAAPYFLSPKELLNPGLAWKWLINGNTVNITSFRKNLLPLQATEDAHGSSKVRLEIENKYKISLPLTKEINVEF